MYHWPIFGPLVPLWVPPKGRFMSKTSLFKAPNSLEHGFFAPEMVTRWPKLVQNTRMGYFGQNLDNLGHLMTISGAKRPYLGAESGLFCSWNSPLGAPRGGGARVQKWVSDSYLVNIGHCSHYVVFGTKFGLPEVKKELFGGPADPSWHP